MGLLDGGAAALFAEIFTPLYLPATTFEMRETQNERGDPRRISTARPCRAQIDSATQTMRTQPDAAATDRAAYILAETLEGSVLEGHEFIAHAGAFAGTRWKVATPITRDPGAAYWLCRLVLGKEQGAPPPVEGDPLYWQREEW